MKRLREVGEFLREVNRLLREKLDAYSDTQSAREWLDANRQRVQRLFEDKSLRDFVFEPFKEVFDTGDLTQNKVRSIITQVAVANAVMAGLPGRMGIGVAVSVALEAWMAYAIARHVGLVIKSPTDVFKYFGVFAAVVGTILFVFRHLLGLAFSVFSIIPGVNPLIPAEIFVTDLVGVLFWVGFKEARESGSFSIPGRMLRTAIEDTRSLFRHQIQILKGTLSLSNLRLVGRRLAAWFKGEIPSDPAVIRGEVFTTVAMAYLVAGHADRFTGPLGSMFIAAVRRVFPEKLGDASIAEIRETLATYDAGQLQGVENAVKGHLFEQMVHRYENADGDEWVAELHEEPNFPGSDIVFTNSETGESIEVSLKATSSPGLIEDALLKYPDIPIVTTDEVSEAFRDNPLVRGSQISDESLREVTQENLEEALDGLERIDVAVGSGAAGTLRAVAALWPFVMAYLRDRITAPQLETAFHRVLGEAGVSIAARVAYGVVLGPIFAWYLLARGVIAITKGAEGSRGANGSGRPTGGRGPTSRGPNGWPKGSRRLVYWGPLAKA